MDGNFIKVSTHIPVSPGRLLISEPTMLDRSFQKSVLYLTHHTEAESMGFVLNREAAYNLDACIEDLDGTPFPLYIGGPVGLESLQFIHQVPDLLGGTAIEDDVFWNGDFEMAFQCIRTGKLSPDDCKFFIGYSGWGQNQLQDELNSNSWLVAHSDANLLFRTEPGNLWTETIKSLGSNFKTLLFVPENPQLN